MCQLFLYTAFYLNLIILMKLKEYGYLSLCMVFLIFFFLNN